MIFSANSYNSTKRPLWLSLLLLCTCLFITDTWATELKRVHVDRLSVDVVQVRLELTEIPPDYRHFSTATPARIIIDLPATSLALPRNRRELLYGKLSSMHMVEAKGRSRVILNLSSASAYAVSEQGNNLIIKLGNKQQIDTAQSQATSAGAIADHAVNVLNKVDFRRGKKGEGRIILDFANANIATDIHEEGGQLVVELLNASITKALERRLDVTDFATVVHSIDSYTRDGRARLVISSVGRVEHLSYQSGKRLLIDIKTPDKEKPDSDEDANAFKGEKLNLNFQDIEVRAVLQIIADFTSLNIVVSDTVTGNVTLRLKNVPWDEALDIILKSKGLALRRSGNILLVAPADEIAERDKRELETRKQRAQLAPLRNETIQVNYAKAADIAALLKSEKTSLLSERGSVSIDERTNKLLLKDSDDNLLQVHRLVKELDVPVRQVLIESRIVIANDDFSRDLGSRFGVTSGNTSGGVGATSGSIGGNNTVIGNGGNITTGTLPGVDDRLNVNLPVNNPAGRLAISVLSGNTLLDMELSALQSEGRGEVISNPRVITSNQKEAEIEQGVEIPYLQSTSSGATSVAFKKAVLSLKVTPQITPDDRIIMDLRVSKDSVGEVFNGVPSINTREVNTQVLVKDGETVVLGGIYEQTYSEEDDSVPGLSAIPGLGAMFRATRKIDDKAELLIFVTPKVIRDSLGTE
ncbi:MAG: type IV pilus secretin PilQ [Gammaproteobacteria bacterium]|nr:type IV pilus secretin PilQ [Gammaproteobacteria bacterium]